MAFVALDRTVYGRGEMGIQEGDRVYVNLAPFIGALQRCKDVVACTVLTSYGDQVEVLTEYPCRPVCLIVDCCWIEGSVELDDPRPCGSHSLHGKLRPSVALSAYGGG